MSGRPTTGHSRPPADAGASSTATPRDHGHSWRQGGQWRSPCRAPRGWECQRRQGGPAPKSHPPKSLPLNPPGTRTVVQGL